MRLFRVLCFPLVFVAPALAIDRPPASLSEAIEQGYHSSDPAVLNAAATFMETQIPAQTRQRRATGIVVGILRVAGRDAQNEALERPQVEAGSSDALTEGQAGSGVAVVHGFSRAIGSPHIGKFNVGMRVNKGDDLNVGVSYMEYDIPGGQTTWSGSGFKVDFTGRF